MDVIISMLSTRNKSHDEMGTSEGSSNEKLKLMSFWVTIFVM